MPTFIAHTGGTEPHDLAEHLRAVADGARARCERFGASPWGEAVGLLHDAGKYSAAFQRRIRGDQIQVDHSTYGAQIAAQHYGPLGQIIAAAVAGHHVGLANGIAARERTALVDRLRANTEDASAFGETFSLPDLTPPRLSPHPTAAVATERRGLQLATFSRMLFGALIDSDWTDTAAYYGQPLAADYASLDEICGALDLFLARLIANAEPTDLNRTRAHILRSMRRRAALPPGLFEAPVPTGGGKTLAVALFALEHALEHGLDRVIYVAPYTAIIDQTADVLRRAVAPFGDSIVEHHTGYRQPHTRRQRQIAESWSAPFVVTTAVQFFESLFTDRPDRARKLPNIARSVVILDEVQTTPLPVLRPCVAVLDELARNYDTSIVLCTATQPAVIERPDQPRRSFVGGFRDVRTIAPDPGDLYRRLRRFTLRDAGALTDQDLAEQMRAQPSALAIVNTRKHAQDLFDRLADDDGGMHLSTLMCPAHRREHLEVVRRRLASGQPVHLVSTSLIEAGVDVDFRAVWRAIAGLDQIAQAGGRCNREGRHDPDDTFVTVFDPSAAESPWYIRKSIQATRRVIRQFGVANAMTLDALEAYFTHLYWQHQANLDEKAILPTLNATASQMLFPHEDISAAMRLIEDEGEAILIPYNDEARLLIDRLREDDPPLGHLARALQPYTVNVYPKDFEVLRAAGVIAPVDADAVFWEAARPERYSDQLGLILEV